MTSEKIAYGHLIEAANTLDTMRTVADLDARASVLKSRETVTNDKLQAFIVEFPADWLPTEVKEAREMIASRLDDFMKVVHAEIRYARTWKESDGDS